MNIEFNVVDVEVPVDWIRVVAMQPFVRLRQIRWHPDEVASQMTAIHNTLDVSGPAGSSFTLFPEYAIPGVDGAKAIDSRVREPTWHNGSVIIGGVHGLDKEEYQELHASLRAKVLPSNAPDSVRSGQWVNCCVTWVKDIHGDVMAWIQPKIKPSAKEATIQSMFSGSGIYVFRGRFGTSGFPCHWVTLICFDWIAGGYDGVLNTILQDLNQKQSSEEHAGALPIHMAFVLQHNKKPNHPTFLGSTERFLTDTNFPWVERQDAIVVHANTAAAAKPVRNGDFGFSACVFSPRTTFLDGIACPTVCQERAPKLRGREDLKKCLDIVFREMGECIHRFDMRVPKFVTGTVDDRTLAIDQAEVFAVQPSPSPDPRLPGTSVPADIKWLNDSLDEIEHFSDRVLSGKPLETEAKDIEAKLHRQIRDVPSGGASRLVEWSTCPGENRVADGHEDPDNWDEDQQHGFEHICHTLTGLGIAYDITLDSDDPHAILQKDRSSPPIQIVTIRGRTHDACREHFDKKVRKPMNDPVLIVSRDCDNTAPTALEFNKFVEPEGYSRTKFIPYQTLLQQCTNANSAVAIRKTLDRLLVDDGRFI